MTGRRILREKKSITAMFGIYCRGKHGNKELCDDCRKLLAYSHERLDKCPFQEKKTPCSDCLVHCYREPMREEVRQVMRFAGPKMMGRHPYLAIRHLMDGKRKKPIERSK